MFSAAISSFQARIVVNSKEQNMSYRSGPNFILRNSYFINEVEQFFDLHQYHLIEITVRSSHLG